jgi:translocation and assembly module TamB
VAVSGLTRLESSAAGLSLRGKLRADHGIIEIQGSAAPALPNDVRLIYDGPEGRRMVDTRGRTVSKDGAAAEPDMPESRLRILTELAVDLGNRLRITGNGVAARLGGSLQVLGTLPDQPRLVGTVNILEGTYQAYGQNLRIDKGAALRFNGPVDNPALDIVAKRPFLPVEVGVSITGTVLNPVITLVSTPDMPDTDKLSWLVLGTDPTNAPSAAQSLALREAARSLLLNDDGRHRPGIAERLGLDVMNFGYGSDTGPAQGITESKNPTGLPGGQGSSSASTTQQEVVTLGKRIGSRLFVSYEQGVRGLYNLLRIQYALSRRLSLRAQSGSDNAVDLLFSYSFD